MRFDDLDSSERSVVIVRASEGSEQVTFEYSVNVTEIDAFGFGSTGQYGTSIPDDAPAGFGIVIGLSQCGLRQQETAEQPEQCRAEGQGKPGDEQAG
ncbi:hypothetical protein LBMAG46_18040 [Planctomycetia bacterium]|nr:hypothetical protein LBMAG46_18040 [Planctomycetia bacterium]